MANDRGELGDARDRNAARAQAVRRRVASIEGLVRLPTVCTAPPDVLLGAALVAGAGIGVSLLDVAGLSMASIFLFAGVSTFLDESDSSGIESERLVRTVEPSRRATVLLGGAFLATGVVVAGASTGVTGALVAGSLAVVVVVAEGRTSDAPVGVLSRGGTRALNVLLGVTAGMGAAGVSSSDLPGTAIVVPLVIGGYVSTVVAISPVETAGSDRRAIATAGAAVVFAVVALGWFLVWIDAGPLELVLSLSLAAAFAGLVGRAILRAYAEPVSVVVAPAVGTALFGLVLLEAAFAVAGGVEWALAIAAFGFPFAVLSRRFAVR
ncbi:4-hydroxybenzoate polyprenyltransferase [Halovivax sp.]|uniref:4-hydroxybenzoate polyprenyltransferase n=1 Tax=Halovivax sp. TaxID=1935978 RepID=UPI0025BBDD64|nr:4-hydroxybenzoate polyprenyltransferase [Halovivax sp.]